MERAISQNRNPPSSIANSLEDKLNQLDNALNQSRHIERLVEDLKSQIFQHFHIHLENDYREITNQVQSLRAFYNLLKVQ